MSIKHDNIVPSCGCKKENSTGMPPAKLDCPEDIPIAMGTARQLGAIATSVGGPAQSVEIIAPIQMEPAMDPPLNFVGDTKEQIEEKFFGYGGGGCPAPWIPILLADKTSLPAEKIEVGMEVWTQHETTNQWGSYAVSHVSMSNNVRWKVEFENDEVFVGTFNHRVKTNNEWKEINKLTGGEEIVTLDKPMIVKSSEYFDIGDVVKITVNQAHTYVTNGFLSHNIKMIDGFKQVSSV